MKWPPLFQYKFRPLNDEVAIDTVRDLVVHSQFWLSSPVDFNDPFDMSAKLVFDGTMKENRHRLKELLKQEGVTWGKREKQIPKLLSRSSIENDKILQRGHFETVKETGVYSFGGDPLNILMWSHYASNHSGICLQFATAKDPKTFLRIVKIKYSHDYPLVHWTTKFSDGLHVILERKHIGWEYEKETRIVVIDGARQYFPFRPEALVAIIIGCCATKASVDTIRNLLAERSAKRLSLPRIYRAVKHESRHKLILKLEIQ